MGRLSRPATYRLAGEVSNQQSLLVTAGRPVASLSSIQEAERLLGLAAAAAIRQLKIAITSDCRRRLERTAKRKPLIHRLRQASLPARPQSSWEIARQARRLAGAASFLRAAVAPSLEDSRPRSIEAVVRAKGERRSRPLANLGLTANPASYFLKRRFRQTRPRALAADPYRVLRVASAYMQLFLSDFAGSDRSFILRARGLERARLCAARSIRWFLLWLSATEAGEDAAGNCRRPSQLSPSLGFSILADRQVVCRPRSR